MSRRVMRRLLFLPAWCHPPAGTEVPDADHLSRRRDSGGGCARLGERELGQGRAAAAQASRFTYRCRKHGPHRGVGARPGLRVLSGARSIASVRRRGGRLRQPSQTTPGGRGGRPRWLCGAVSLRPGVADQTCPSAHAIAASGGVSGALGQQRPAGRVLRRGQGRVRVGRPALSATSLSLTPQPTCGMALYVQRHETFAAL